MRIFKNRWFVKFAVREKIGDAKLREAVRRAEAGSLDADLGGGVLKQRIARDGGGKSGGYRTLLFFRQGERAIFVFAFAKSDRANLDADELAAFKKAAKILLGLSSTEIAIEIEAGRLMEASGDDENI